MRPHRWQPTRLPHPWDSPGKNTGVGCHFLLQCMKVKSESEVAQSSLTPSDPMDCSLPGSSIHWIFRGRILEWVAISFSRLTLETSVFPDKCHSELLTKRLNTCPLGARTAPCSHLGLKRICCHLLLGGARCFLGRRVLSHNSRLKLGRAPLPLIT